MTPLNPLYMAWLDYQIARFSGLMKFYPNNRIDRLMSDPEALRLFDRLGAGATLSSQDR